MAARLFLPFLALCLVVGLAFGRQVAVAFGAIGVLAAVYLLSIYWSRRAARALRCRRRFVDRAFTGESIPVELIVENTGPLPVSWLAMDEVVPSYLGESPAPQVFGLRGHEERRFTYAVDCRRRGYHALGPLRVETGDLLGFDTGARDLQEPSRLIVYPRIVPLEKLGLPTASALAALPAPRALFEDPGRVIGVREYEPRDSMRRIHWKATMRTGELLVKQYQRAISRDTLICLDLDLKGYALRQRNQAIETAISVAASLAHHIVTREHLAAGLATDALDPLVGESVPIALPSRPREDQLISILEVLARVQAASGDHVAAVLRRGTVELAYGSTVVLITGSLDDELSAAVVGVKRAGHAVAVILVQPAGEHGGVSGVGGVPIYRVAAGDGAIVEGSP
jgi:uncharacterized protein (DUF58 family)